MMQTPHLRKHPYVVYHDDAPGPNVFFGKLETCLAMRTKIAARTVTEHTVNQYQVPRFLPNRGEVIGIRKCRSVSYVKRCKPEVGVLDMTFVQHDFYSGMPLRIMFQADDPTRPIR